jgi:hypothetical protein
MAGSAFMAGLLEETSGASSACGAALAAAVLATFFAGAAAGAATGGGIASRNFRMTGGSTVEDAERTNSPRSASLAKMTLLSTPNSLASS